MTRRAIIRSLLEKIGASVLIACGIIILLHLILIMLYEKVRIFESSTTILYLEIAGSCLIILLGLYLLLGNNRVMKWRLAMAEVIRFSNRNDALEYARRKQNEGFFDAQVVKRADGSYTVLVKPSKAAKEVSVKASGPIITEQAIEREEKKILNAEEDTAKTTKVSRATKRGTPPVKIETVAKPSLVKSYYWFRKPKRKTSLGVPVGKATKSSAGLGTLATPQWPSALSRQSLTRGAKRVVSYSTRIRHAAPRARIATTGELGTPTQGGSMPRIAAVPKLK